MAVITQMPDVDRGSGEGLSTVSSLALAIGGGLFFFLMPGWTPNSEIWLYVLPWPVLGYLALQLIVLLSSAISSHRIGFVDTIVSVLPAIVGIVVEIEYLQGILHLSAFQHNALRLMIGTATLEALITLWGRFTVYRRTIVLDST